MQISIRKTLYTRNSAKISIHSSQAIKLKSPINRTGKKCKAYYGFCCTYESSFFKHIEQNYCQWTILFSLVENLAVSDFVQQFWATTKKVICMCVQRISHLYYLWLDIANVWTMGELLEYAKGQLISKCLYEVIVWTKIVAHNRPRPFFSVLARLPKRPKNRNSVPPKVSLAVLKIF